MNQQQQQILTQKSLLVVLGGGLYDGSRHEKRLIKKLKVSQGTTKDKKTIQTDIKRWAKDYKLIINSLTGSGTNNAKVNNGNNKGKQKSKSGGGGGTLECWNCVPVKLQPQKSEYVTLLKLFFKTPAQNYVIYWSGHGEIDSGDWSFHNEQSIKLQEVLDLWMDPNSLGYHNQKMLLIISDSCYSGAWINDLQNLAQLPKYQNCRVAIQAGCRSDEESFVHVISEEYLASLSKDPSNNANSHVRYTANLPDTLLMRKMVFEMGRDIRQLSDRFPWTYVNQTPCYYATPNLHTSEHKTETGETYCTVKNGFQPDGFSFRMVAIDKCWAISKDHKQAIFGKEHKLKGLFFDSS